mmetsp:Transcript_87506/g.152332  ORF Transcript_87506/g.152332 Transcript_87506/m.152332 type:complete len:314 (-) Transcript_87506:575-1516(-)
MLAGELGLVLMTAVGGKDLGAGRIPSSTSFAAGLLQLRQRYRMKAASATASILGSRPGRTREPGRPGVGALPSVLPSALLLRGSDAVRSPTEVCMSMAPSYTMSPTTCWRRRFAIRWNSDRPTFRRSTFCMYPSRSATLSMSCSQRWLPTDSNVSRTRVSSTSRSSSTVSTRSLSAFRSSPTCSAFSAKLACSCICWNCVAWARIASSNAEVSVASRRASNSLWSALLLRVCSALPRRLMTLSSLPSTRLRSCFMLSTKPRKMGVDWRYLSRVSRGASEVVMDSTRGLWKSNILYTPSSSNVWSPSSLSCAVS